ncbi:hydrolase [Sesbania bispinosa]|nr:hydrolase [Sesbania bispinosa]
MDFSVQESSYSSHSEYKKIFEKAIESGAYYPLLWWPHLESLESVNVGLDIKPKSLHNDPQSLETMPFNDHHHLHLLEGSAQNYGENIVTVIKQEQDCSEDESHASSNSITNESTTNQQYQSNHSSTQCKSPRPKRIRRRPKYWDDYAH